MRYITYNVKIRLKNTYCVTEKIKNREIYHFDLFYPYKDMFNLEIGGIKMFFITKKDKKIGNLKIMLENKSKFIDRQCKENYMLYKENRNLQYENEKQRQVMNEIRNIVSIQNQGTRVDKFEKIKEVLIAWKSEKDMF